MTIQQIIDKHLNLELESKIGWHGEVEPEMTSERKSQYKDFSFWNPIQSTVTDNEIVEYEKRIGFKLPESYKKFLQYKHFYALRISECFFEPFPIRHWRNYLEKMIYDGWPTEYMIDK